MNTVIKVENLYKEYNLGTIDHGVLYKDLQSWWAKIRGKDDPNARVDFNSRVDHEKFLALDDISFKIKQGEIVGIIGKNGAGKSTLLKILSRVTSPTKGKVKIKGRVASLLEVGTGFHPELTGRENIFLNGAILGMSKKEIQTKLDQIIDFSGVETYIDTPVKRYSSGMYVRLAFSVSAHLDPEILIVDEVLAVGDAEFQKKCLGKMEDVGKEGRTVLFVSHNMGAVKSLCTKAILLSQGKVAFTGATDDVVNKYYSGDMNIEYTGVNNYTAGSSNSYKDDEAELLEASIVDINGNNAPNYELHDSFSIKMKFSIKKNKRNSVMVPNFHFYSVDGTRLFISSPVDCKVSAPGVYEALCHIPGSLLNDISYVVGVALTSYSDKGEKVVHYFDKSALMFTIFEDREKNKVRYGYGGSVPGYVRPGLDWSINTTEN